MVDMPDQPSNSATSETPARDRLAVAAAALGILGVVVALLFPARFRLPYDDVVLFFEVARPGFSSGFAGILLALPGLPALLLGMISLRKISRRHGELSGKALAAAGAICGAILTLFSALLLFEPFSTRFEASYAQALLQSVHGKERDLALPVLYGQVIHDANLVLGRIALRQGRIGEAKRHLLEAGKSPGSAPLSSFGPNMSLAKALFEKGERETVIAYLELCTKFWETGRPYLRAWISLAKAGGVPDFNSSGPPPKSQPESPAESPRASPPGSLPGVLQAWRSGAIRAYGPEGTALRQAEPGKMWLAVLIELAAPPVPARLNFGELTVVDEAGGRHAAVAIAGPAPEGFAPRFLFVEEAFAKWRGDSLEPSSFTWGFSYEGGQRSEITLSVDRRRIFRIAKPGIVEFPSEREMPVRLYLLFAPHVKAGQFELRFGTHAQVVVPGVGDAPATAVTSFEEERNARIASLAQACDAGEAKACSTLAPIHYGGRIVPKDLSRAAALFQKACDLGNAQDCSHLAGMHENGEGVQQDLARTVELYRKACDGKNALGCTRLGYKYARGEAVPKDEARAAALYLSGCNGGDEEGCAYLGWMYFSGSGVPRDEGRAVPLLKRACDANHAWACSVLGLAHFRGTGVARDPLRAAVLYKQACDGGIADACGNLAMMQRYGQGIPKDEARALSAFELACQRGHAPSCQELKQRSR